MFFPEDIWKLIKEYNFDYVNYWKKIFTKNILLDDILNTNREFSNKFITINKEYIYNDEPTSITIIRLSNEQLNSFYYYEHNIKYNQYYTHGWINFTKDKYKKRYQNRWMRRRQKLIEYNNEQKKLIWDCDEEFSREEIMNNECLDLDWGLFDTDDY